MKKLLILLICTGCTLTISIQPLKKQVVVKEVVGFQPSITPTFPSGNLTMDCITCPVGTFENDSTWNLKSNPYITLTPWKE